MVSVALVGGACALHPRGSAPAASPPPASTAERCVERNLTVRMAKGAFELPFVVERSLACEGTARVARLVEAREANGVLAVRLQNATVASGEPPRDVEENAYLCAFENDAPTCTRVRSASLR